MVRSYVIALAIITPLMFLLLGNLRGGAAAMVPNLAPIIVTLGFMGWTGIPLDLFTLLIGSIAIGLAVDDTIHFMHNFRKLYEATGDVRHAVRETLRTTGHALLVTSIVLSLAFFVYMFASLQNLVLFGLLTGFTIITAFVADVTVSPALMTLAARHDVLAAERARRREQLAAASAEESAVRRGRGRPVSSAGAEASPDPAFRRGRRPLPLRAGDRVEGFPDAPENRSRRRKPCTLSDPVTSLFRPSIPAPWAFGFATAVHGWGLLVPLVALSSLLPGQRRGRRRCRGPSA